MNDNKKTIRASGLPIGLSVCLGLGSVLGHNREDDNEDHTDDQQQVRKIQLNKIAARRPDGAAAQFFFTD